MSLTLIQLSSHSIEFPPRSEKNASYSCTISLKNTKSKSKVMFKIKTKRLNTYQVKPPKGILEPNQSKKILFKVIRPLGDEQIQEIVLRDKFLIEAIEMKSGQIDEEAKVNKEKLSKLWKQNQENSDSHESTTLSVMFKGLEKVLKSVASHFDDNGSNLKRVPAVEKKEKISDEKLSKMLEQLKSKEERLVKERENIIQPREPAEKQSLSVGKICLLIFLFLVSVMIGNFLKLRVFVEEESL